MHGSTVKDIFMRAFSERRDAELLAFMGWAVWNRRNQLRFNEASCPLNQILPLSKDRKTEFQRIHPVTRMPQHRNHTRWKPPEQGVYKVNYDGAVFSQQGKASLGVIIRNHEGAVMASMAQQIPLPTTMAQVEAVAQYGELLNLRWKLVSLRQYWRVTQKPLSRSLWNRILL